MPDADHFYTVSVNTEHCPWTSWAPSQQANRQFSSPSLANLVSMTYTNPHLLTLSCKETTGEERSQVITRELFFEEETETSDSTHPMDSVWHLTKCLSVATKEAILTMSRACIYFIRLFHMKNSTKLDLHFILSTSLGKVLASLQLPMLESIWEKTDFGKHRGSLNTKDPAKSPSSDKDPQGRQRSAPETKHTELWGARSTVIPNEKMMGAACNLCPPNGELFTRVVTE